MYRKPIYLYSLNLLVNYATSQIYIYISSCFDCFCNNKNCVWPEKSFYGCKEVTSPSPKLLLFFLFFFCQLLLPSHIQKDLHNYTNIKHQNIHNTKQTYNFTKDWVCVCMSNYSSNNCHLRL